MRVTPKHLADADALLTLLPLFWLLIFFFLGRQILLFSPSMHRALEGITSRNPPPYLFTTYIYVVFLS